MKKLNKLFCIISGVSIPIVTVPIVLTSCSSKADYKEMSKKIDVSLKEIMSEESAINLQKYFSSARETVTKEGIYEIIDFNKDTYVIQELINNNLFEEYREVAANSVYESYIENESLFNDNSRCGSLFSSHFWKGVWHELQSAIIFSMSKLWWDLQITVTILGFIETGDGAVLAEGIASFDPNVPDFFRVLMHKVLTNIKNFKFQTKCKWKFLIWSDNGALIRI